MDSKNKVSLLERDFLEMMNEDNTIIRRAMAYIGELEEYVATIQGLTSSIANDYVLGNTVRQLIEQEVKNA